jgi:hypothetical protein
MLDVSDLHCVRTDALGDVKGIQRESLLHDTIPLLWGSGHPEDFKHWDLDTHETVILGERTSCNLDIKGLGPNRYLLLASILQFWKLPLDEHSAHGSMWKHTTGILPGMQHFGAIRLVWRPRRFMPASRPRSAEKRTPLPPPCTPRLKNSRIPVHDICIMACESI